MARFKIEIEACDENDGFEPYEGEVEVEAEDAFDALIKYEQELAYPGRHIAIHVTMLEDK
jgi:hypothetical protein